MSITFYSNTWSAPVTFNPVKKNMISALLHLDHLFGLNHHIWSHFWNWSLSNTQSSALVGWPLKNPPSYPFSIALHYLRENCAQSPSPMLAATKKSCWPSVVQRVFTETALDAIIQSYTCTSFIQLLCCLQLLAQPWLTALLGKEQEIVLRMESVKKLQEDQPAEVKSKQVTSFAFWAFDHPSRDIDHVRIKFSIDPSFLNSVLYYLDKELNRHWGIWYRENLFDSSFKV